MEETQVCGLDVETCLGGVVFGAFLSMHSEYNPSEGTCPTEGFFGLEAVQQTEVSNLNLLRCAYFDTIATGKI